jgi:TrmH family RNA methyltransferase
MGIVENIGSQKHWVIELMRDIQTHKGRMTRGAFHVEGAMVVRRALQAGRTRFILCTDRFANSSEFTDFGGLDVDCYVVSEGLMSKAVPAKPVPGITACVDLLLEEPASLLEGYSPLIFLVDRCENPDNLGMLLRSLDAAGIDGVVLTDDGADPFNRLSVRASRGAVLNLKLAIVHDSEIWVNAARLRNFKIIATSAHGDVCIWDEDLTVPLVIIVGNEHTGVRESLKILSDSVVYLPMSGLMQSLNIAVAGAVVAYEAIRQRRG